MRLLFATALCLLWCRAFAALESPATNIRLVDAQTAFEQGRTLKKSGKYAEATLLVQRALQIREAALGERHAEVASCLNLLGELHLLQGDTIRAEQLFGRALTIREDVLGKTHPNVAVTINNLAAVYMHQGLYVRAEPLYERALEVMEATLGKRHPNVAGALTNLAILLTSRGHYARAKPLFERALGIQRTAHGGNHPNVAITLSSLADLYKAQGLYARAEPLYERALELLMAAFGANHPQVGQALNNLALLYTSQGRYAQAEPLFNRALVIVEVALGRNHPEVARTLNNLALLYTNQGRYAQAEPLFNRALVIVEAVLGKNHSAVAVTLANLADLYKAQGRYAQAEHLMVRALAIREAIFGDKHPDVASSLNSLALLYKFQGHYTRARSLYERAHEIGKTSLGGSHPDVALTLNNLAALHKAQGLYADAAPLYERALEIRKTTLGESHPDFAQSLNNLAALYMEQGLSARAEPLLIRAWEIYEAPLGSNHPDVAQSLNNLAACYEAQRLYPRAEPLYARALEIRKATLGDSHPDVAESLSNLAAFYQKQGLHARAEPLLIRAREIREAAFDDNHPDVAQSLNNLAVLYMDQGLNARAEPLLMRAREIYEEAFGSNHPTVVLALNNLAKLHLAEQRLDAALPLLQRALTASERHLRRQLHGFSEQSLASFLELLREQEEFLYSIARVHPQHPRVLQLALSAALLRQGRSVREVAHTSHFIYRSLEQGDRETFEFLRGLRTEFAALSLAGPGNLSPTDYQQRLKELSDKGDALEVALARRSEQFRRLHALPLPDEIISRVKAALPKDGALVEFVVHNDRHLWTEQGLLHSQRPSELRYLAILLLADGRVHTLDLGLAEPIESASLSLQDALAKTGSYMPAAQELYTLAVRPLQAHLGKVRRLFIVPDGQLNLVPFAALHDGGGFLGEAFDITYLTSGKDLLPRPQVRSRPRSVVVIADPAFTALPASSSAEPTEPGDKKRSASLEPLFSSLRSMQADSRWVRLEATLEEAKAVHRLFPRARLLLGPLATKQALMKLPTPAILHVATHGFFLEAISQPSPPQGKRAPVSPGVIATPWPKCPPEPLLCSGLVLAGAGAPATPSAPPPIENSWVTALELAGLNLWGTQLVVLSACETGRGDVKLGQGVAGLRRALVAAGAETLVTSLWSVDDNATASLMESYYRRLRKGQGRASALREAMNELRKTRPHPHYWAPFIAIGLDAPLQGFSPSAQARSTP
jgi:tetratricopeptide (TPR) repeat protein